MDATGGIKAKKVFLMPVRSTNRGTMDLIYGMIIGKAVELNSICSIALPLLGTGDFYLKYFCWKKICGWAMEIFRIIARIIAKLS